MAGWGFEDSRVAERGGGRGFVKGRVAEGVAGGGSCKVGWSGQGGVLEAGRELGLEPGGMNDCEMKGICGDRFKDFDGPNINSLEDLLAAAGIEKYVRFICGYHIHGRAAERGEFCALDWYAQDNDMVKRKPNEWVHYLILDQVCPVLWYKATTYQKRDAYDGWYEHKVGASKS